VAASLLSACSSTVRWVWPTPYPLPAGATAVSLDVLTAHPIPPGAEVIDACPLRPIDPFEIEYHPEDAATPIHYRFSDGYQHVVWGIGFSARLDPTLEIVAPDGKVVARQDVLTGPMIGGHLDQGLYVCVSGYSAVKQP
jgi:hypothetical protein